MLKTSFFSKLVQVQSESSSTHGKKVYFVDRLLKITFTLNNIEVWFLCQKQSFMDVLRERCSKNMHQIYRRTPMSKCDFNKVTKQIHWNRISAWQFSSKFAAYLRKPFPDNTYEQLLLLCDFNIDLVWVYSISISSSLYHCFFHFNTIQYITSVIEICKLEGFEKFW